METGSLYEGGVILKELAPVGLLAHEHEKSASLSAVLDAGNDKWVRIR